MARMKKAHWQGEHGSRTMTQYDIVCVHTIVGNAPAHAAHFSIHGDGRIDQSRDTSKRSAANLDGNYRIIANENEDHGPQFKAWSGADVPPLTDEQVTANAEILAWAHEVHGVPLQLCPDSRPGSKGLAYHRQGIDGDFGTKAHPFPGRVSGGETWTLSRGKVCPGDRRIAQLPEILRQAKAIVAGKNPQKEKPVAAKNHVQKGQEALAKSLAYKREAISEFRLADKDREVVQDNAAELRETYAMDADIYNENPKK